MSERLTRRDMLKIAGVAALGSALGTATVGGGLIYFSKSEPQPVRPVLAKPEYAPPPPAPVAKAEPAPQPAKPVTAAKPERNLAPPLNDESLRKVYPPEDNLLNIAKKTLDSGGRLANSLSSNPFVVIPLGVVGVAFAIQLLAPSNRGYKGCGRCGNCFGCRPES